MITTIIIIVTILASLLYILAGVLGMVVYSIRVPLLLVVLILIPTIIVKIYGEIKKYGRKKVLRFSSKEPENEQVNLVEYILKKTNNTNHVIRLQNKILIFLSESGIYLIKVIDYYGQVSGNEQETYLTLKGETTKFIPNFFYELKELENKLKIKLPNQEMNKIIVSKETCQIGVTYKEKFKMVGIHSFYCETQMWTKKQTYTEEQVNQINTIISTYLGEEET